MFKNKSQRKKNATDNRSIEDQDQEVKKERKNIKKKREKTARKVFKSIGREIIENVLINSTDRKRENKKDIDIILRATNDKAQSLLFYSFLRIDKLFDFTFHRDIAFQTLNLI